ncbi:7-cyano-7-deazaguanine synthase QueC [Hyphomonas johnsonii]|jgi:7-cyano-7-deazaguanine synthase|uniref:7-cyano-7-deazaguanine synthase n=1 Tax=Hyphomonas johnsonii MHS-2 TaxID=1280950 RepID=A0A059FQZ2_9PROT|nr:7-cyano-7-deazaguanine synthase QueC [Hyphomonas johnsonii]KCZ92951.1 exsB protein [Hyphomonas johnsonii MHS-2]
MIENRTSALVLFSGGQDSATCLAGALARFRRVETVGFDYGQRHRVELDCRTRFLQAIRDDFPRWGEHLGADHMLDASVLKGLGQSAMTDDVAIEMTKAGLPSTFVPGRNLLFFTLAGALAYRRGIDVLVGGMCETDYSGYPDCRAATLAAQEQTLRLGLDMDIRIDAPLMNIDKAETWAMANRLGGARLVDLIVEETHTCYLGDRTQRHAWGYGCGTCPACELRANGWARWKATA